MNDVGLCSNCVRCRVITARRSRFYLCERSATDPSFPRYPRLPVLACRGFEARGDEADPEDGQAAKRQREGR